MRRSAACLAIVLLLSSCGYREAPQVEPQSPSPSALTTTTTHPSVSESIPTAASQTALVSIPPTTHPTATESATIPSAGASSPAGRAKITVFQTDPTLGIEAAASFDEEKQMYSPLTIRSSSQETITYHWSTSGNLGFPPSFEKISDKEGGRIRLAAILVKDYGSGFLVTEAHVLDMETLQELPLEELADTLGKRTSIQGSTLTVDGKSMKLTPLGDDKPNFRLAPEDWLSYEVKGGQLVAQVGVESSPGHAVGYVNVTYQEKVGKFEAASVTYSDGLGTE